jgi:serine/threonine-protein kinase
VGSPVVEYGVVYVGTRDQNVYALNAQTGKKLWNYPMIVAEEDTKEPPEPMVANGVVYIADSSGSSVLYALSAANGKELWRYQANELFRQPVIVDNKIYIATYTSMYAFSTITPSVTLTFTVNA